MTKKATTYNHGVPWEDGFGVTQGYSVNGTIYISGQFSHDMQGAFVGEGDFEAQTRKTLENLDRVLAGFNITKSNIADDGDLPHKPARAFRAMRCSVQGVRGATSSGRHPHRRVWPGVPSSTD